MDRLRGINWLSSIKSIIIDKGYFLVLFLLKFYPEHSVTILNGVLYQVTCLI